MENEEQIVKKKIFKVSQNLMFLSFLLKKTTVQWSPGSKFVFKHFENLSMLYGWKPQNLQERDFDTNLKGLHGNN